MSELYEWQVVLDTLDVLGSRMAEEGLTWTAFERRSYERAVKICKENLNRLNAGV